MGKGFTKIKRWLHNEFGFAPEVVYPAVDKHQTKYRSEFDDIVDRYLINYESDRDKDHPDAYHRIVYIDAENDVDWIEEGTKLNEQQYILRNQYIAKLDVVHALPVQNLSDKEVFIFKKILGVGYNSALIGNFEQVEMAMKEAKEYRDDRNKESSRWLLLTAATFIIVLIAIGYWLYIRNVQGSPHLEMISGIVMGAIGSYVSIWSRYGKIDMTGLGSKKLHYLEAASRILIGAIFAFVLLCALKGGLVFAELVNSTQILPIFIVFGFFAGFSEKFVPSVLESFVHQS